MLLPEFYCKNFPHSPHNPKCYINVLQATSKVKLNQGFSFLDEDILRKVTVFFGLPLQKVTMLYNVV